MQEFCHVGAHGMAWHETSEYMFFPICMHIICLLVLGIHGIYS